MPNYKAPDNSLHFLDDAAFAHLLPVGSVEISDEEAEALRPKQPVPNPIIEQITAIEATITPRRMREAALTDDGKVWLAARDAEIAALRGQL